MELILARSKAGHDKDRLYAVVARENNILFLADGRYRKIDNPKKKKEKHVQPIYRFPDPVRVLIEGIAELKDSDLRKIIKSYEQLTNKEN